ncbi:hypothetical protein [Sessilibacter sp. MAH4]
MSWEIIQTEEYASWFLEQDEFTQLKVRQAVEELKLKGPMLGRPQADTLHGSKKYF